MKIEDDFLTVCNVLDKRYKNSKEDSLILTRKVLYEYINKDYNMFLKLKTEAVDSKNYFEISTFYILVINMVLAGLNLIISSADSEIVDFFCMIVLILFLLLTFYYLSKNRKKERWRKYILAILNEIENKCYS